MQSEKILAIREAQNEEEEDDDEEEEKQEKEKENQENAAGPSVEHEEDLGGSGIIRASLQFKKYR